jgi:hypothetical protein
MWRPKGLFSDMNDPSFCPVQAHVLRRDGVARNPFCFAPANVRRFHHLTD